MQGSYSFEADVWSTGIILYILLSGLPPFPGNNERQIFQRILKLPLDLDSDPWENISDEAKNLVSMCVPAANAVLSIFSTSVIILTVRQKQLFKEKLSLLVSCVKCCKRRHNACLLLVQATAERPKEEDHNWGGIEAHMAGLCS